MNRFVGQALGMCRYLVTNFLASLPKIDSPTRQLIPFAPTVLRPLRLRTTSFLALRKCRRRGLSATNRPRFALHGDQRGSHSLYGNPLVPTFRVGVHENSG